MPLAGRGDRPTPAAPSSRSSSSWVMRPPNEWPMMIGFDGRPEMNVACVSTTSPTPTPAIRGRVGADLLDGAVHARPLGRVDGPAGGARSGRPRAARRASSSRARGSGRSSRVRRAWARERSWGCLLALARTQRADRTQVRAPDDGRVSGDLLLLEQVEHAPHDVVHRGPALAALEEVGHRVAVVVLGLRLRLRRGLGLRWRSLGLGRLVGHASRRSRRRRWREVGRTGVRRPCAAASISRAEGRSSSVA